MRARNGLRSFLDIELNEDVLDVRFHGLGCDGKTSRDFLVGSTSSDKIEDVALADAERLCNSESRFCLNVRLITRASFDEVVGVRHESCRISCTRHLFSNA